MILSVAQNPPHRCGDIEVLRDMICIYFDLRISWWQMFCNGKISGGKSAESLQSALEKLGGEIGKKCRKGQQRKAVVFINDLDVTRYILPEGTATKAKKKKAGIEYSIEYITEYFIFRNFNILFNSRSEKISEMFPDVPTCQAMAEFLRMFDLPVKDLRYSLAYITKKVFYKDIKAELWEDTKRERRMLRELKTWQDMQAGNQGGMLSGFAGDSCILFEHLHNIGSFDKKSAYPSYFVQDAFFPIGKVMRIVGGEQYKLRYLKAVASRGKWFKIVIDSEEDIKELMQFKTPNKGEYGIEFWDAQTLKKCGLSLFDILRGKKFRLYICSRTGRMPDCFRRKIFELYNRKNAIKDKSSPERFLIKTQIDMIYGKGLQKFDFQSDRDVFKKYILRGDNFMTPQMSMHVVAAMRHELVTIASNFESEVVAFDTDGVKLKMSEENKERIFSFFDAVNDYIKMKNEDAGFPSDIGIWDFEYCASDFIQFAPKVYAYYSGELHCKFAGISQRHLRKYIGGRSAAEMFAEWEQIGIDAQTGGGWCYIPEIKSFIEQKVDYKILKG